MSYMKKEHISIDELRTDSFIYIVSEFICTNSECEYSKIKFIEKTLDNLFSFENADKAKSEKLIPLLKIAVTNGSWVIDEKEIESRMSESKQIISNLLAIL